MTRTISPRRQARHLLWSGDAISADAPMLYRGTVVRFCNPGCRETVESARHQFEAAMAEPEQAGDDNG